MLKLLEIGLNSPECVKIVCKVCEILQVNFGILLLSVQGPTDTNWVWQLECGMEYISQQ